MDLTVDASVILAVLLSEPERGALLHLTEGADLIAPASVHWEVGNALSAMLKRNRVTREQVMATVDAYEQIPIRFTEVDLRDAMEIAAQWGIYAYDAYLVACSRKHRCRLISLDRALLRVATQAGVTVVEVSG